MKKGIVLLLIANLLWTASSAPSPLLAQIDDTTHRVSVASDSSQADAASARPTLSADGRFVAFDSLAANLVISDTNGVQDVFVHDRQTGQTSRVSLASDGAQANGASDQPALSADGRYVAFVSAADNLVTGDTNGSDDIFVHDRQTGQTVRVSVNKEGGQGSEWGNAANPAISGNGRFVAFDVDGVLTADDSPNFRDVFVHDRDESGNGVFDEAGDIQTARVSLASDGSEGDWHSQMPDLSDDGRFVVFESGATSLAPDKNSYTADIFLHDRDADADSVFDEAGAIRTQRISLGRDASEANGPSRAPAISGDGRFSVFASRATNLLAVDTPSGQTHIYLYTQQTGQLALMDRAVDADAPAAGSAAWPSISADGRFVAFESGADDLVRWDTNYANDIFLRDRDTDQNAIFDEPGLFRIQRVSLAANGDQAVSASHAPALVAADGGIIAFQSFAANLVANDTNGEHDVFVRVRVLNHPPITNNDWAQIQTSTYPSIEIDVLHNDYDPEGAPLSVSAVGRARRGTAAVSGISKVLYFVSGWAANGSWDSFTYTVTDGIWQVPGQVSITICREDCLIRVLFDRSTCDPPLAAASTDRALPSARAGGHSPAFDLNLFYRVRDEILAATPEGQRYIDLFYTHNPQLLFHLLAAPDLWDDALALLELWQPALQALVDGQGESVTLSAAQTDALSAFLTDLTAVADGNLRQAIAAEQTRLGPLEEYAGMSVETARSAVVGNAVYLPAVLGADE